MTFAIITAVCFGLNSLIVKNLTDKGWGETALVWLNFAIGLPLLVLVALIWGGWDRFERPFWIALPCGVAGNMIAVTLLYRAIRQTRVSIVLPLVALSPIYMTVTSWIMVGENISAVGLMGILLVVAGAYSLGCGKDRSSLIAPLRALWRDPGARTAFGVSILWSITANFDKIAVAASDELSYASIFTLGMAVCYFPFFRRRRNAPTERALWKASLPALAALGLSYSVMAASHMTALDLIPVPYVITIKRAGILVAVLYDLARGERGIGWTALGGLLALSGVAVIAISD